MSHLKHIINTNSTGIGIITLFLLAIMMGACGGDGQDSYRPTTLAETCVIKDGETPTSYTERLKSVAVTVKECSDVARSFLTIEEGGHQRPPRNPYDNELCKELRETQHRDGEIWLSACNEWVDGQNIEMMEQE